MTNSEIKKKIIYIIIPIIIGNLIGIITKNHVFYIKAKNYKRSKILKSILDLL